MVFGKNVFDVAQLGGLKWKWNIGTIRCLGLYGHSLNTDTLCAGVYRMPPASKVSIINGKLSIKALSTRHFEWDIEKGMENAFFEMNRSFDECVGNA